MAKKKASDYEKEYLLESEKADSKKVPMRSVSFKIPKKTAIDFQVFCTRNEFKKGELCNTALLFYMDKLIKEEGATKP